MFLSCSHRGSYRRGCLTVISPAPRFRGSVGLRWRLPVLRDARVGRLSGQVKAIAGLCATSFWLTIPPCRLR